MATGCRLGVSWARRPESTERHAPARFKAQRQPAPRNTNAHSPADVRVGSLSAARCLLRSTELPLSPPVFSSRVSIGFFHHWGKPCQARSADKREGLWKPVSPDAQRALAFVAKHQGRDAMAEATWANVMSLELGWFGPADAKRFVAGCKGAGLLVAAGDQLELGFSRDSVTVPRGFRATLESVPDAPMESAAPTPRPNAGKKAGPSGDSFVDLLDRIASALGEDRAKVMARIEAVQAHFGGRLEAEAAAVRVALDAGLDATAHAKVALERLKESA